MKKIVSMVLCLLMVAATFTACRTATTPNASPAPGTSGVVSEVLPETSPGTESSGIVSATESGAASGAASGEAVADRKLSDFRDTMKETYGEDYIPDRVLDEAEISETIGLSSDLYDDIYAEGSTLEENPDVFIGVKAKEGKAEEVEKILQDYKNDLLTNNLYEGNKERIESAQIFQEDDHVFMFILGKNTLGEGIEDLAEGFKKEMQKGADAIKRLFS